MALEATERAALDTFVARVRNAFGTRVREIMLFGSRARGEARDDSDIDVAVVVDDLTSAEGVSIAHLAGDVLTEHSVLVSPFAVSTAHMSQLRERERLIATEIARDGISL